MAENTNDRACVKFDLWERKLLDLSTRNSLLNLKIKGSCIPLFVPVLGELEDTLVDNKEYRIIARKSPDKKAEKAEKADPKQDTKAIEPVTDADNNEKPAEDKQPAAEAVKESAELPAVKTEPESLPESSSVPAEEKKEPAKMAEATGIPARDYSIEDLAHPDEFKE